jgi:hypothetical protein
MRYYAGIFIARKCEMERCKSQSTLARVAGGGFPGPCTRRVPRGAVADRVATALGAAASEVYHTFGAGAMVSGWAVSNCMVSPCSYTYLLQLHSSSQEPRKYPLIA